MKKLKLTTLLFLIINSLIYSQEENLKKYASALSDITTYADNKGFMEEISLKDSNKKIKWKVNKNYNYTTELEYIEVFAYKIIYKEKNNYIVSVYQANDGNEINSYIFDLIIKDDTIKLNKIISGGNRCNNSVKPDKIKFENNVINYTIHITGEEFLTWFKRNKTYGCFSCCFGLATYDYDISSKKNTLKYIRLIKENIDPNSKVFKVYNKFIKKRDLKLSLTLNKRQLKKFLKALQKK